jgi:glycosyltransferase involved in cell wall biosynthesis
MKILIVSHQSTKEGAGLFLLEAATYLLNKGFKLVVVFPENGPLALDFVALDIKCYYIKNNWWTKDHEDLEIKLPKMELQVSKLCRVIKNEQPDIIYSNTIVDIAGAIAAARLGLPHIWHFHELPYAAGAIEMGIQKMELAGLISNTTNLIICNAEIVLNEWKDEITNVESLIVKNWIQPNAEHNGITQPTDDSSTRCFIQVGSIVRLKGQIDTVKAFHFLILEGFTCHLYLIGPIIDNSYYAEIMEYLRENKLNDYVTFTSYLEDPFLSFKNIIASISASLHESFGRTTVESMYYSIPVIGAAGGGNLDLIKDNITGLLYEPGDHEGLKDKMKSLATDGVLRENLSKEGRIFANQFTNAAKEMDPLIEKLNALHGIKNPSWPIFKYHKQVSTKNKFINFLQSVKLKVLHKIVYFSSRKGRNNYNQIF